MQLTITFGGMGLLAQHRGGACFCTRDDVLNFSFRYKVVGVCKNRDTTAGGPASAGQPVPPLQIFRGGYKVFAAQKPIAYTDLLGKVFIQIRFIYRSISSDAVWNATR